MHSRSDLARQRIQFYALRPQAAWRRTRLRSPEVGAPSFEELTERTAGIWEAGDGLAYQERLRAKWERE